MSQRPDQRPPSVFTPPEAAEHLRSNPRTLERWRVRGEGPAFVKIGRRVGYRQADLERWLQQQTRQHTGEP